MERADKIFHHPVYQKHFLELQEMEKERIFCNHTLEHFLDVARLMYIAHLEKGLTQKKDVIYAAALLHDIGRGIQYSAGIPHDLASVQISEEILPECGYSEEEIAMIYHAILHHRQSKQQKDNSSAENAKNAQYSECSEYSEDAEALAEALYTADKQSRNCFACPALEECNWSAEKKNMAIRG